MGVESRVEVIRRADNSSLVYCLMQDGVEKESSSEGNAIRKNLDD